MAAAANLSGKEMIQPTSGMQYTAEAIMPTMRKADAKYTHKILVTGDIRDTPPKLIAVSGRIARLAVKVFASI